MRGTSSSTPLGVFQLIKDPAGVFIALNGTTIEVVDAFDITSISNIAFLNAGEEIAVIYVAAHPFTLQGVSFFGSLSYITIQRIGSQSIRFLGRRDDTSPPSILF